MEFDEQYSESFAALHALARVRARIWEVLDRELQTQEQISMTWFEVLARLAQSDGALPMNELASALLSSPSGMTRLVDRIESSGLVHRTPHESDRRVTLVELTDQGRDLLERVMPGIKRVVVEGFASRLSEEQASSLRSILELLLEATGGVEPDDGECSPEQVATKRQSARSPRVTVRS
ncbi:MAG: MarR family transcriptional regulator [Chloroflexota bacterium]|nr:MarR family transcriptional regulator [Chloroflexota bacterium]